MGIILLIFALIAPRITILVLWFFTGWFNGLFNNIIWPIIGFIFLPVTLLWYSIVYNWYDNSWGTLQYVILIVAVLIDLSPASKRRKKRYERR
jgi:hypothetical protein